MTYPNIFTRIIACVLVSLITAPHPRAETREPEQWQLVGQAQLNVMFFNIYQSRLYTRDGEYAAGQLPVRLDIKYQRDISAETLVEQTQKEWRHLGISQTKVREWSPRLTELWPNIQKDDRLSFQVDAQGTGSFTHNGNRLGTIDDTEMADSFLAIWLSPNTSRPEHRQQLIGVITHD